MITGGIPVPTPDSEEFWRGCREGYLSVPVCRECGEFNWFPRAMCRNCSSVDLDWQRLKGDATVYSFSVIGQGPSQAKVKGDGEPYVLALVDLVEGVRMMTHLLEIEPDEIVIGMRVAVRFQKISDEISLPVFVSASKKYRP